MHRNTRYKSEQYIHFSWLSNFSVILWIAIRNKFSTRGIYKRFRRPSPVMQQHRGERKRRHLYHIVDSANLFAVNTIKPTRQDISRMPYSLTDLTIVTPILASVSETIVSKDLFCSDHFSTTATISVSFNAELIFTLNGVIRPPIGIFFLNYVTVFFQIYQQITWMKRQTSFPKQSYEHQWQQW